MVDNICLFEDVYYKRLLPLVYFRPLYDLRCGILTLREKITKQYPNIPVSLHCRSYLKDLVKQQNPGFYVNEISGKSCLFINGRVIVDEVFKEKINLSGNDKIYFKGDICIAAKVSGSKLDLLKSHLPDLFSISSFHDIDREETDVNVISYPWDLVNANGKQIISDFNILTKDIKGDKVKGKVYEGAFLLNRDNIYIGEGSKVKPGVVLDAEGGPIYIGSNVEVFPNSTIEGPAFIGDGSKIKVGAKIYENTSIGPVCKVGGEVEASIFHSYSNKQHDGFLGHSYLGMWVNLGADTNNSDLKNNYGNVKVIINGEQIDSGSMFVGLTIGDHSKSGINTMFNTGTVVGVSSNIYGGGFPSKYIPSFSWGGSESLIGYDLGKSIEVAKRVMNRRKVEMTEVDETLFKKVFDLTKEERIKKGMSE